MQVTETLSEGLRRAFSVVVPAAEIETKAKAKLAEISLAPSGCQGSARARCR